MGINDSREEKAQLGRREFDLDTEEQERQRKERDARIIKVNPRRSSQRFNAILAPVCRCAMKRSRRTSFVS